MILHRFQQHLIQNEKYSKIIDILKEQILLSYLEYKNKHNLLDYNATLNVSSTTNSITLAPGEYRELTRGAHPRKPGDVCTQPVSHQG